jgi:hypothetical protein
LVGGNPGAVLAAVAAVILVLAVVNVWLAVRVSHLSRGYRRLVTGADGKDLEQLLHGHLDRVVAAAARADEVAAACKELEGRMAGCVQHIGVLRFDAFEDVGGQLSFALALLDDAGNGMVLSSLHGRQETRLFAKPMRDGKSEVPLTLEEVQALKQAGVEATPSRLVRADR